MADASPFTPDDTALRTALWRALHVEIDPPPHVFADVVGLRLAAPPDGWQNRPDMSQFTRPFRASILARARFVEDLVADELARGITEIMALAREAGFKHVRHVSAAALAQRYFAQRTDGLRPPDNSEELLVAST